jgi:hypothetical protein
MGRAATTRTHLWPGTLDQETAVGLEQRHTRSRHRQSGRVERDQSGHRLYEARIKFFCGKANRLRLTPGGHTGRPSRLRSHGYYGSLGRGRAAAGHPACAGDLATTADLRLGHRQIDRLHLCEHGAKGSEENPGEAFHGRGEWIGMGGRCATPYSLDDRISQGSHWLLAALTRIAAAIGASALGTVTVGWTAAGGRGRLFLGKKRANTERGDSDESNQGFLHSSR